MILILPFLKFSSFLSEPTLLDRLENTGILCRFYERTSVWELFDEALLENLGILKISGLNSGKALESDSSELAASLWRCSKLWDLDQVFGAAALNALDCLKCYTNAAHCSHTAYVRKWKVSILWQLRWSFQMRIGAAILNFRIWSCEC